MIKKIHWIMVNIVSFVLIALVLFVPMFTLHAINGDIFKDVTIFGFHFVTGYMFENPALDAASGQFTQAIISSIDGLIPTMMFLSIFVINKLSKSKIGKDVINFLASAISFVFIFLLPVIAYNYVGEDFYAELEFIKLAGYWINVVILALVLIYYSFILIHNIIQINKINQAKIAEDYKEVEDKYEESIL